MFKYDLHTHTKASSCSGMSPEKLVETALSRNLDGIAVTDHDTMENVEEVRGIAEGENLRVISGVEVTTTQGHILAWFVDEVPESQQPMNVIRDIHEQNGFAALAHPKDRLRQTFSSPEVYREADVIEAVNSRVLIPSMNRKAEQKAEAYSKPVSGGSDAHYPFEIGRAYTLVESENLEEALRKGEIRAKGRGGYFSGHMVTKLRDLRNTL